jgi:two-component system chemotaxis response regulator CheY
MSLPDSIEMSPESNNSNLPRQGRILIANDQEWTARSLESILAVEGLEVVRAYTGQQAHDKALATRPDLIVLDVQLPDISGPEVCRMLRTNPSVGWSTPIVLTTAGSNGRARQLEVLEAGATDFAAQPFDGELLLLKIRTLLRAKAASDLAISRSLQDEDTGLYNYRGLAMRMAELSAEARRHREPLTYLTVSAGSPDLFEAMQAGEEVGRLVGRAIKGVVRASDVVARVSPTEFVIVAPSLPGELAAGLIERLERYVAAASPPERPPILLRAGHAVVDPDEVLTPDALMAKTAK